MASTECSICWTDAQIAFSCLTHPCTTHTCVECTVRYFAECEAQSIIPICTGCERKVLYKDCKSVQDSYLKCMSAYFLSLYKNDEKIQYKMEVRETIRKVRDDRNLFISAKFPPAIQLVVVLAMDKKLSNINKMRAEVLLKDEGMVRVPCMNVSCKGSLNKNYVCRLCDTSFCKECERKKKDGHVCSEDDIMSVKEVKSIVKCPKCGIPIFKHTGCLHMTCASCKTNFNYKTGEECIAGSSNMGVKLKVKTVSELYKKELEQVHALEAIQEIEKNTKEIEYSGSFMRCVIRLIEGDTSKELILKIAEKHDRYHEDVIKAKRAILALREVEDLLVEGKLTVELIQRILQNM